MPVPERPRTPFFSDVLQPVPQQIRRACPPQGRPFVVLTNGQPQRPERREPPTTSTPNRRHTMIQPQPTTVLLLLAQQQQQQLERRTWRDLNPGPLARALAWWRYQRRTSVPASEPLAWTAPAAASGESLVTRAATGGWAPSSLRRPAPVGSGEHVRRQRGRRARRARRDLHVSPRRPDRRGL